MAEQWYYSQEGTQYGPVAPAQLRELAASGKLGADECQLSQSTLTSVGSVGQGGASFFTAPPHATGSDNDSLDHNNTMPSAKQLGMKVTLSRQAMLLT